MKLSVFSASALSLSLLFSVTSYAAASGNEAQKDIVKPKELGLIHQATANEIVSKSLPNSKASFTFLGKAVDIYNSPKPLSVNNKVPAILLVDDNLEQIPVGGANSKSQVIASIVSINTPVCAKEALDLEQIASKNPGVDFIIVSKDLPFALSKFAKENKLTHVKFASSFRSDVFGKTFDTLITNSVLKGLNSRAVFVINTKGKLVYQQRVNEIATPPNYKTLSLAIGSIKDSEID